MNPNIARKRHAKSAHVRNEQTSHNGHSGHSQINVGDFERQVSMWGGTVLAAYGLLRVNVGSGAHCNRRRPDLRGHTGHCEMYHMLGHSSADQAEHTGQRNTATDSHGEAVQAHA